MALASKKNDGKYKVNKLESFCELSEDIWPYAGISFEDLFNRFDDEVWKQYPSVSSNAMNNVHGDWYEYIVALIFNNTAYQHNLKWVAIPLPNKKRYDLSLMYVPKWRAYITDLRDKMMAVSNVNLITSNPDFVIINKDIISNELYPCEPTPSDITRLNNLYTQLEGKCELDDIKGHFGIKRTVRPDRRLQFAHEGSLQKAIYAHLQTRDWILNPKGIKYYAISSKFSDEDITGLRTVATHSIVTVNDNPKPAVDETFIVNSVEHCVDAAKKILS